MITGVIARSRSRWPLAANERPFTLPSFLPPSALGRCEQEQATLLVGLVNGVRRPDGAFEFLAVESNALKGRFSSCWLARDVQGQRCHERC